MKYFAETGCCLISNLVFIPSQLQNELCRIVLVSSLPSGAGRVGACAQTWQAFQWRDRHLAVFSLFQYPLHACSVAKVWVQINTPQSLLGTSRHYVMKLVPIARTLTVISQNFGSDNPTFAFGSIPTHAKSNHSVS